MVKKRLVFFIVTAISILLAYVAIAGVTIPIGVYDVRLPGVPDIRYGIDIKGGVDAVFLPKDLERSPTDEELETAKAVIETRLDQKNILDREVTIDSQNKSINVRFPWKADEKDFDPQKAIAELGETAKLTFRDPEGNIIVEGKDVTNARPDTNPEQGGPYVALSFNSTGAKQFADATARLIGQPIGIYMDEDVISQPTVQVAIPNGEASITNMGTMEDAKALADKIKAGALPFSMETSNHSTISPTLGSGALDVMVSAALLAYIIIAVFMIVYYRLPGFVACIGLLLHTAGQLLAISVPQITLTLPGISAIILSIGMGVDANIIIAERISEEIKAGKTLDFAITSGFKNAFTSVFDGNITVLIVSIILMIFGSGSLLSFAYSLLTGVVMNFIAGVTCSRLMIRSLSRYKGLRNTKLYQCFSRRISA